MVEIVALTAEQAREVWPKVEHYIARALKRTEIDRLSLPCDVLFRIAREQKTLWIVHEQSQIQAAIVTQINIYDRCRSCCVHLVGGKNLSQWLAKANAVLEDYARKAGCSFMEGGGREGWSRCAGYERKGHVLIKEL